MIIGVGSRIFTRIELSVPGKCECREYSNGAFKTMLFIIFCGNKVWVNSFGWIDIFFQLLYYNSTGILAKKGGWWEKITGSTSIQIRQLKSVNSNPRQFKSVNSNPDFGPAIFSGVCIFFSVGVTQEVNSMQRVIKRAIFGLFLLFRKVLVFKVILRGLGPPKNFWAWQKLGFFSYLSL